MQVDETKSNTRLQWTWTKNFIRNASTWSTWYTCTTFRAWSSERRIDVFPPKYTKISIYCYSVDFFSFFIKVYQNYKKIFKWVEERIKYYVIYFFKYFNSLYQFDLLLSSDVIVTIGYWILVYIGYWRHHHVTRTHPRRTLTNIDYIFMHEMCCDVDTPYIIWHINYFTEKIWNNNNYENWMDALCWSYSERQYTEKEYHHFKK